MATPTKLVKIERGINAGLFKLINTKGADGRLRMSRAVAVTFCEREINHWNRIINDSDRNDECITAKSLVSAWEARRDELLAGQD